MPILRTLNARTTRTNAPPTPSSAATPVPGWVLCCSVALLLCCSVGKLPPSDALLNISGVVQLWGMSDTR
ncbi:hypothetical protein, partial [Acetobacter senegalensis]